MQSEHWSCAQTQLVERHPALVRLHVITTRTRISREFCVAPLKKCSRPGLRCDSLELWRHGDSAMRADRLVMQESLFYEFCLDEFVPSNHMLR